jgi:hypothetical protein
MNWVKKGAQLLVVASAALAVSRYVLADSEPDKDDYVETGVVGNSFVDTATVTTSTQSAGGVFAVEGMTGNGQCRGCTKDFAMRLEPPAMLFFGLGLIGVSQIAKWKKNTHKQS